MTYQIAFLHIQKGIGLFGLSDFIQPIRAIKMWLAGKQPAVQKFASFF